MNTKFTDTIKAEDTLSLYREVVVMRQALDKLYKRLVRILPAREGSEEWWDREVELGMEDYRAGRVKKYSSPNEFLQSIK